MKPVRNILLASALVVTPPVIADEFSELDKYSNAAQMELDAETGGCLNTLKMQNDTIARMKTLLDERKGRIAELEGAMQPLNSELTQCKVSLAGAGKQGQSQVASLQAENAKLKQQLAGASSTGDKAVNLALYATQLEGEVKSLKEQLLLAQNDNKKLVQENSALRTRPASTPTPAKPVELAVVSTPVTTPVATPVVASSGGKIVGKLLSMRRNTTKKKDELVIGVALTNSTGKAIQGILVGPEITAIDSSNNMFSTKHMNDVKGITMCQSGQKLYNEMSWCETQIKNKHFSTTSFRPGVPVNVLLTIPALNADPDVKTTQLNTTTLFLLIEDEEGTYEKFPVDILGGVPTST